MVWQHARKQCGEVGGQNQRDAWPKTVAVWVGCTPTRARELLWGVGKSADLVEMEALAENRNLVLDDLASKRLLSPKQVLANNIAYLFDGLDHGSKGDFARAIGVDVSTISRWRRGVAKPSRTHIQKLCEQFALDVGTDLESQPLFLSPTPVSLAQRRDWLKRRIEHLSPQELNELFPALRLLLGSDHAAD